MKRLIVLILLCGCIAAAQIDTPVAHIAQPLPELDQVLVIWVPMDATASAITGAVLRIIGSEGEVETRYEDKPLTTGKYWTIVVFLPSGMTTTALYLMPVESGQIQPVPLQ